LSLQSLINSEVEEITNKIQALDGIRAKLEQDLLKLQEDELELDDECERIIPSVDLRHVNVTKLVEGVKERLKFEEASSQSKINSVANLHLPPSSRRRKGMFSIPFFFFSKELHW